MGRLIRILGALVLTVLILVAGTFFLASDNAPRIESSPPPAASDVVAARNLVRDLRNATRSDQQGDVPVVATIDQLNSATRLGARLLPGVRGDFRSSGGALIGRASIPVPWPLGERWINIAGEIPEFDGEIAFHRVQLGGWNIRPALARDIAKGATNAYFGEAVGDTLLDAVTAMSIDGDEVTFTVALSEMGENGLVRRVFGSIRGQDFPTPEQIDAAYIQIRTAMDDGILPTEGSFGPYLQYTLNLALEESGEMGLSNAYTAALFGLTRACGPRDFGALVGRLAITTTVPVGDWDTECSEITLNGRIDSRRHFIASAALRAAANRGVSFSIGEFKELHDTVSGAGGFDFTDIGANLSGIRMTDHFMALPEDLWRGAIGSLSEERAYIIDFDGIPGLMPEDEFLETFGTVESPPYQAMLSLIEARIDELPLHLAANE